MAASPSFKVYDADGDYRAACKFVEDAAVLVASYGAGATIRFGHAVSGIFWREGNEAQSAAESYDYVRERFEEWREWRRDERGKR